MQSHDESVHIEKRCAAFAEALAAQLIANGRGVEWPNVDESWLAMRASQEVEELRYEIDYVGRTGAEREALDVGAFAMMIWDNLQPKRL